MRAEMTKVFAGALALAFGGAVAARAEVRGPTASAPATPARAGENPARARDQELVSKLHALNRDEINMAKTVEGRLTNAKVKSYAATLVRDHNGADAKLLAYAERNNMNMADVGRPGDAMAHGALAMSDVTNSSRAEIDYTFASKMVADHQAAIDVAQNAQRLAVDPELKALIGDMLPALRTHLATAQSLVATLRPPPARVVAPPGEPSGVSRTHTGADERPGPGR